MTQLSDILEAMYRGDPATAEKLAAGRATLDLFEAAALGRVERLRALTTEDRTCVGWFAADGFTALQLAAFFGHTAAAKLLLEHGADVNAPSRNPLMVQPLHSAAARGGPELIALLLDAGADPNARQAGGYTPLQARAAHGDMAMTQLLLKHGADAALRSDDGRTALDMAREKGHADIVALLAPLTASK